MTEPIPTQSNLALLNPSEENPPKLGSHELVLISGHPNISNVRKVSGEDIASHSKALSGWSAYLAAVPVCTLISQPNEVIYSQNFLDNFILVYQDDIWCQRWPIPSRLQSGTFNILLSMAFEDGGFLAHFQSY